MANTKIKKVIAITVACTSIAVILLVWGITAAIDLSEASKDWRSREALGDHAPCDGRIVHIAAYDDGYILYVDTNRATSAQNELFEVWVYDDTTIVGEVDGLSLEEMIKDQMPGAYVTMECFVGTEKIKDTHFLHPAMIISTT